MRATDCRQLVSDLDVEAEAEKIAADAPPLSSAQLDVLRAIFLSTNVNEAGSITTGPARPDRRPSPHQGNDHG